jgi:hypothetical protein
MRLVTTTTEYKGISMKYEIKTRVFSSSKDVAYQCPHCQGNLISPLGDAGIQDDCPECGGSFIVPGTSALNREIKKAEEKAKSLADRAKAKSDTPRRRVPADPTPAPQTAMTGMTANGMPTIVINNSASANAVNYATSSNRGCLWVFMMLFAIGLCVTVYGAIIGIPLIILLLMVK